ncbi:OsmC family protein [Candidatus Nitrospira allomarina]|uniref:OsmC family protein n=1 Tax=Candidatus Nitrospira allomarina TaxID=3020900 RepID=A0AA96GJT3_9BACT|nr:OsmC family protein [Candidatus Nitrospira allomarina]WNM59704.1 OsmC family protein [Candidatus Nitrospira allomarina]
MADAQILNGVNVAAVNELVKNVESDPKLGECRFHIKNTWSTCGQNQSKVSSFYAAKQEIPHDDPFTLNADEPSILAGHDTGANPVEHLLHALAGCLTTTLVYHAAVRGIKIDALESELEGDLDIRGFLGLSNKVRSGFENIRVNFKVKTDAENIEKLKALSKLSPVFDMTSHGTNVQVNIERKEC